jgi:predicted ArsR family transcriptional regulator
MKHTELDKRFFASSRGQIVSLLRGSRMTVNDLAARLELTDNAVRAHLLSLERDGLVRQAGLQRGTRKPHFSYESTPEAEALFPKAYDTLLNRLIAVLKTKLTVKELRSILRQVGRSLAGTRAADTDLKGRLDQGLAALEALGGSARVEKAEGKVFIRSASCPLAVAVAEHPEVCQLAESLLSEIVGTPVREHCERGNSPRCSFEIAEK